MYGEKGVCSSIIRDRLVFTSQEDQKTLEKLLSNFKSFKVAISERCLRTVFLVYCNYYFKRCDNASSVIRPVQVCREACDVMEQQHCKEEFPKAREINREGGRNGWFFHLINCTTLPRRNGGTFPECYYPREFKGT